MRYFSGPFMHTNRNLAVFTTLFEYIFAEATSWDAGLFPFDGGRIPNGYWNCNVDFLRSAMCTFFFIQKVKRLPLHFPFSKLPLSSILLPRSLASSITTGWCTRIVAGVYWGRKLEGKKLVYLQIP